MLYLVSTPIGNLGDISQRARDILQSADIVACEDTRVTSHLFSLLGLKYKKLFPYHEHNADKARPELIRFLKNSLSVALVSDAGTPLISDPGYKLVQACYTENIPVTPVPGANAILPALQLSGLPTNSFYFGGFLPSKTKARQDAFRQVKEYQTTLVFYETAGRLIDSLKDALDILSDRNCAVVREITKKFEEAKRGTIEEVISYYETNGAPKGEIVLVFDKPGDTRIAEAEIDVHIRRLIKNNSVRDTVAQLTDMTGLSKKEIYQKVLKVQDEEA
ncbi:MAG: 16S rRNA (cytidine(1402)-2'-O)-methyltransferase [Lactobacillales bacterium]|jgi:16S rRNA (cytidine1402-2'-O)-methyltransferase|nr:16S rRNA (cytidine(1402)-2'-O)-methyltransferase [Lactobacillales bacterium]